MTVEPQVELKRFGYFGQTDLGTQLHKALMSNYKHIGGDFPGVPVNYGTPEAAIKRVMEQQRAARQRQGFVPLAVVARGTEKVAGVVALISGESLRGPRMWYGFSPHLLTGVQFSCWMASQDYRREECGLQGPLLPEIMLRMRDALPNPLIDRCWTLARVNRGDNGHVVKTLEDSGFRAFGSPGDYRGVDGVATLRQPYATPALN